MVLGARPLIRKFKYDFSFLFIANPVIENELDELELLLRQKLRQETVSYILFCGEIKFLFNNFRDDFFVS
jgi:hypothetical protein